MLFLLPAVSVSVAATGEVTLVAVGDVMLGRYVQKRYGGQFDLGDIKRVLQSADLVFGNLEACFGNSSVKPSSTGVLLSAPEESALVLKRMGFNVLSLANNHCADLGLKAIERTQALLAQSGIVCFGAGENEIEARRPRILSVRGLRVGFLGYSAHAAKKKERAVAVLEAGVVIEDIGRLRPQVDFLVVSFHWGKEYSEFPSPSQVEVARQAVDAGADLIVGHHPHVLQRLESYKGRLIAYSLGNFIFDQREPATLSSLILHCTILPRRITAIHLYPIRIEEYLPRSPEKAEVGSWGAGIKRLSRRSLSERPWRLSWNGWKR